ncbi:MAG: hypothetical protein HKN13_08005 [Rhodothermales bacterium]|nr:hypothetical protein [Rhodothermales bacterium]
MKRNTAVLLLLVVVCILGLLLGSDDLLDTRLPGSLPLGTLFAILALVAGAAISFIRSRPGTPLRLVGVVALVAAALWFPVGVYLSGNVDLNFVDDATDSAMFDKLTRGIAVFILGSMIWSFVDWFIGSRTENDDPITNET